MKLNILLFANLRDIFKAPAVTIEIQAPCSGQQLIDHMISIKPEMAPLKPHLKLSVNGTYANLTDKIPEGAEIAVFPPVSGG